MKRGIVLAGMPLNDYLIGLAYLAVTGGLVVAATAVLVRRRLPHLRGAPRTLAFVLVATAILLAVHLLPGVVGLLSRRSVLVCAGAVLALTLVVRRSSAGGPEAPPPHPADSGRLSWLLASVALGAVVVSTVATAWRDSATPSVDIDTLTFHLPNVARWIQSGSFWQVDQFTPLLANGNYPHNGDVVFLAVVMPWENDAFVRFVGTPFVFVAGLAVYAIARELGAPRATSVLAGAVFASLPALSFAAHEGAKTDPIMLATFGAGALFLLRHFRTGRRSDLVLAGLGLGIAFGTKWYGVTSVAGVLAVWAGAWLLDRRPARGLVASGGLLVAVIAAAGGFWLVRNLVESDNPFFPTEIAVLGATIFDAPRDFIRECAGFQIIDYLTSPGVWRTFILPDYADNYAVAGGLVAAGWTLALLLSVLRARRPGSRDLSSGKVLAVVAAAAALAAAYAATPYSAFGPRDAPAFVGANTRWALPAFLIAAPVLAWVAARVQRLRLAVELLALVAVADGIRRGLPVRGELLVKLGLLLAVAAGIGYATVRLTSRLGRAPALAARSLVVVAVAGSLIAVGYARQQDFNASRYLTAGDPVISWFGRSAPEGHTVALAGVWDVRGLSPVLPAFGPRLGNDVEFVGEFVHGQLREYRTPPELQAALRRGNYDLMVVGKGTYESCPVPGSEVDENAWARAEGFQKLAESERLVLYDLTSRSGGA